METFQPKVTINSAENKVLKTTEKKFGIQFNKIK